MGEKTRGGNQSMELSHINHFLQLLQSNKVVSCTNFNIYFFEKNPEGFFPHLKTPSGFLTLTFFFTMTEFLFWGLNTYVLLI